MNRREALRLFGVGGAAGGLAATGVIVSLPSEVPAAERSIASMFEEWFAMHHRDCSGETDDELEASMARYQDVQNQIIRAVPSTPRDVAMQFYADTGNHASEVSEEFGDRLLAMAIEGRAA